jgi:Zn2+/Cd2+-exporting ATPase
MKNKDDHSDSSWKILLISAVLCGLFLLISFLIEKNIGFTAFVIPIYLLSYFTGGWNLAIDCFTALRKKKFDIHILMLSVAIGAAFIGAWWEGATLLFLFSISEALEAMAMARAEREIKSLFHHAPKVATMIGEDGNLSEVLVDQLFAGQRIKVLPDSQFAVDAKILTGNTAVDESMLTGEAIPVDKSPGDLVFGGTLNTWGVVDALVIHPSNQSSHEKIIRMIRDAQASKAPSQRFTDRFGTKYTISIFVICIAAFCYWHFVEKLPVFDKINQEKNTALYRAMTLLVVASPCALVISIPSAILAGIAVAARKGILFRGGIALEKFASITRIALDKTGTLTKGEFEIISIQLINSTDENKLLECAAALSQKSTHPLSRAIASEWLKRSGNLAAEVSEYESLAGKGVQGVFRGILAIQGKRELFSGMSFLQNLSDPEQGTTEVVVQHGDLAGRIILRDAVRQESKHVIEELQHRGLKVVMLTGDRPESAALLAKELTLDEIRSSLSPEQKVEAILEWRKQGDVVAMVGDGVNDAPSLAVADVAIGMGLRGSDAVLEQADIVLLNDQIQKVLTAFDLSKKCRSIIKQNLIISLSVLVLLAIIAMGFPLPLSLGVLGHEGSTIIVILNSLRLLFYKD